MCGIVGYTGPKKPLNLVIQGLRCLEYRGYDSAGIVLSAKNKALKLFKKTGHLAALESILPESIKADAAIGHTRWATHGGVTDANAHPHVSWKGNVAVVHNGIIDNYRVLRAELEAEGVPFLSETDSEVIAHLAEKYLELGPKQAVLKTLERIQGTFGLAFVFKDHPELIIGARNGSPLAVGVGNGEMFLSSDPIAFGGHTRQVIYLQDREIVILRPEEWEIRDFKNEVLEKTTETVDYIENPSDKGGFEHFLMKEIAEQPDSINRALGQGGRLVPDFGTVKLGGLNLEKRDLLGIKRVVFLGMGTALYAAQIGARLMETWARVPSQAEDSSEVRTGNPIVDQDTLYIAVSQSGETMDTLSAVQEIMHKGGRVLGIVNTVGSSLARLCGAGVYTHSGPEMSVASTKAFTGQVTIMVLLALMMGRMRGLSLGQGQNYLKEITGVPDKIRDVLKDQSRARDWARQIADSDSVLFLGRGLQAPVAAEGALKLKEITYIHAEGFAAGSLKHGPLALVKEGTPAVFLVTEGDSLERVLGNMAEVKARGGRMFTVSNLDDPRIRHLSDEFWLVPLTCEEMAPLVTVVPLQLLAYETALFLGRDVDRPRNLAKSVTTE